MDMNSMSNSLKAWGVYLVVVPGLGLMIAPEALLDLFGLSHGGELWLARMIGLLAFILGVLDWAIASYEHVRLYKLTVILRYFAAAFMIGLWLTGQVAIHILLIASMDVLFSTWTMLTIRSSQRAAASP